LKRPMRVILIMFTVAFAFSCASAPKPPVAEAPKVETPKVEAPAVPKASPVLTEKMALAQQKRDLITKNGLDAYAPAPYAKAEEQFKAAEAKRSTDEAAALKSVEAALPLYDETIASGFAKKVGEKKDAAAAAKARADAEKAKVAAKEEYAAAEKATEDAKAAALGAKFPEAISAYDKSVSSYDASAKLAAERRVLADEAIKKANEAIKNTDSRLKEIDAEIKKEGVAQ